MQKAQQTREVWAALGIAWAGMVWGLFWLPLRGMESAGISPSWATFIFFFLPALLALPLAALRLNGLRAMGWPAHLTSIVSVFAMALYSAAVLNTEVIRAIVLFYLTPLWSTLLARWLLKEAITPARLISMALAFSGLGVMVLGKDELGLSRAGDWMALAAGLIWAYAAVRLRRSEDKHPYDMSLGYLLWGGPCALLFIASPAALANPPAWESVASMLPWILPFLAFLVGPSVFTSIYGCRRISPGLVGLLFMPEIATGTFTAAIWAGEPMGPREWLGVALITSAGLFESLWSFRNASSSRT